MAHFCRGVMAIECEGALQQNPTPSCDMTLKGSCRFVCARVPSLPRSWQQLASSMACHATFQL